MALNGEEYQFNRAPGVISRQKPVDCLESLIAQIETAAAVTAMLLLIKTWFRCRPHYTRGIHHCCGEGGCTEQTTELPAPLIRAKPPYEY